MATSSGGGYGTYSPAAIDPFPIESVLAKIVGDNNPGNAANLLGQYQVERQTSQGNYDYAMNQQHQFAKDSLAQQIANEHVKNLLEGNKTPGGLSLLQQSGNAYDIDPGLVTNLERNQRAMQVAEQAQKGGAGAASFTAAGAQPTQEGMNVLSGGTAGPVGDPTAIGVAKLKLQGDLARAAASGQHNKYMSVPVKFGETERGEPIMGTMPVRIGASDAEIAEAAAQAKRTYTGFYPPGTGLPGATAAGASGPQTAPAAVRQSPTATNIPQNPQKPATPATPAVQPATTPAPAAPASKQFVLDPGAQNAAKVALKRLPPDQKAQVLANLQGSVVPIIQSQSGKFVFVGRNGQTYEVPNR